MSRKTGGVRRSVPRGLLGPKPRSVQKVSRECLRSVKKVSQTLRGHPVGHSVGHPRFPEHTRGHSPEQSGPKGPRDSCSRLAGSQGKGLKAEEGEEWGKRGGRKGARKHTLKTLIWYAYGLGTTTGRGSNRCLYIYIYIWFSLFVWARCLARKHINKSPEISGQSRKIWLVSAPKSQRIRKTFSGISCWISTALITANSCRRCQRFSLPCNTGKNGHLKRIPLKKDGLFVSVAWERC